MLTGSPSPRAKDEWQLDEERCRVVDSVFQSPIFNATTLREESEIPAPTANRILNVVRGAGIVQTLRSGRSRRAGVFLVPEILAVAEGGPEVQSGTRS